MAQNVYRLKFHAPPTSLSTRTFPAFGEMPAPSPAPGSSHAVPSAIQQRSTEPNPPPHQRAAQNRVHDSDALEAHGGTPVTGRSHTGEDNAQAIAHLLQQILAAVEDVGRFRSALVEDMQQVTVELALAIGSKLAFDRLQSDDCPIDAIVRELALQFQPTETLQVRLHPADLALLRSRKEATEPLWSDASRLKLVDDSTLPRGGCRIDGESYGLLSDPAERLNRVRSRLLDEIENA